MARIAKRLKIIKVEPQFRVVRHGPDVINLEMPLACLLTGGKLSKNHLRFYFLTVFGKKNDDSWFPSTRSALVAIPDNSLPAENPPVDIVAALG